MKNNITTTGYITEREKQVIDRLTYEKTVTLSLVKFNDYFGSFPKKAREKLIYRLNKKGILRRIKNGLYVFSPIGTGPRGRNISEYKIPGLLFPEGNYYIGYSPMYNYYKFTDQIFQVIYILNTKIQREMEIGGIKFKLLKVRENRMYGISEMEAMGAKAKISDRERTLVDLLYFPDSVGGLRTAYEIMIEKAKGKELNLNRFISYLLIFPSASVRKRAGYILEKAGIRTGSLVKTIKPGSLMTLYGGKSRKGKIDKKWGVIVNDTY